MSITNNYIKLGVSNNKAIKIKYENHSATYKKAQLTIAKKSYELSEFILKKIINKEFSKTENYIFSLKIDTIYIYSNCIFDTKNIRQVKVITDEGGHKVTQYIPYRDGGEPNIDVFIPDDYKDESDELLFKDYK